MSETVRVKKELREAKKLTGQGQVIGDEGLYFFEEERGRELEREAIERGREKEENRERSECVC